MSLQLPSLFESLLATGAFYIIYCLYWELTTGAFRRRLIKEKGCQTPTKYPDWDPILGLGVYRETIAWMKNHTLLANSRQRFAKVGVNTFLSKAAGRKFLFTIEPENLKSIQALDFKNWSLGSRRKWAFAKFLGSGIFTTDGAPWQHSREMLRPNFVRSQVGDMDTFETHVGHLIDAIPRDGSTVDLAELFFRLTMDSATEFLFGESTNCLAPGTSTVSSSNFATAFNRGQDHVGNRARFGLIDYLRPGNSFKKDTKVVHDFVDAFVEKGLARRHSAKFNPSSRYVFLDELILQTTDKVQIRSELLNILLAGRDTTASLLSNVWFELSKRPDIYAKLRAEIDTLGGERPSFTRLKELKYLRAVLNESLRLYPVVPGNSREAVNDTTLPLGGGHDGQSPVFVPKGTIVGWSVYTMHRRKDYYGEDSEEFRPERWLGEKGLRPGWEYLPFNGGPRVCLGQQFALTEASYTTIRLMQEFTTLESRDPEPWTEYLTLTCTGKNGCKVSMTPVS